MHLRTLSHLVVCALLLSACGGAGSTGSASEPAAGSDGGDMNASSTTSSSQKPAVEIVDSGFGQSESGIQAIVVVTTDNEAAIGESVTASVNFLDSKGQIIATEEQVESFNWVGQDLVLPVMPFPEGKVKVAKIEPSVSLSDYGMTQTAKAPLPVLEATEIKKAEYGDGYSASFAFTNETDSDLKDLRVGVVCYDKAKKIIGGTSTYPSLAPAGKTVRIDAEPIVSAKPASCKAFVNYDVL